MRLPIALALGWPDRVPDAAAAVDWATAHTWTFEPVDIDAFPGRRWPRRLGAPAVAPAVYNAANEVAVAGFPPGGCPFWRS